MLLKFLARRNVTNMMIACLCAIIFLVLTGCSSSALITTKMNVNGASYLNPDVNGQPSPVMVSFYELTAPMSFKQADYFQLQANPGSVLGNDLIDEQTIELRPGQSLEHVVSIPMSVQYIGIAAGYRNIDQADWRKLIQIPQKQSHWYSSGGHELHIQVDLHSQQIVAQLVK
jgi:type VI secretion system protein VasD